MRSIPWPYIFRLGSGRAFVPSPRRYWVWSLNIRIACADTEYRDRPRVLRMDTGHSSLARCELPAENNFIVDANVNS